MLSIFVSTRGLRSVFPLRRFRGELFGLGTNHTKYKSKAAGGASGAANGATPQLQYNTSVHYPHAPPVSMGQLAANGSNGNFAYDEYN